jgi:uridylate kinase
MLDTKLAFKKVLLKLSGESLCKVGKQGIDPEEIDIIADTLKVVHGLGVQLAVVVGGGNMLRGADLSKRGVNRDSADYMGMLGTLINALALQAALEALDVPTRVQTAIPTERVAEPYIQRRAIRHLEKGRVVILAGGAGIPRFTTDTTAVLRTKELGLDVLLKATKVDGVYTANPSVYPEAKRYVKLSYEDAIDKRLDVMDATAFTLAEEHQVKIVVFNVKKKDSILKAVRGEDIGTTIDSCLVSSLESTSEDKQKSVD